MSPYGTTPSSDTPVPQRCPDCQNDSTIERVIVSGVPVGIHYWKCARCAHVWGTRDDLDLGTLDRAAISDRSEW